MPLPFNIGGAFNSKATQANNYFDKKGQQQPVVGALGKQGSLSVQGTGKILNGDIKGGAKDLASSALHTVTDVGGLSALNDPGARTVVGRSSYGGTPGAAAAIQARDVAGIATGSGYINQGVSTLGSAVDQAGANRNLALDMQNTGTNLGASGIVGQNAAIDASTAAANQRVGSLAEAQQLAATQQQGQQMLAQAAAARGGNQAAAIRGAQAQASANGLATQQQIGMQRLAEEQTRRAGIVQANEAAAAAHGDQATLGYGTANQSLGIANNATGQVGQSGSAIGALGTTTQGQYLGADTTQNADQLSSDTQRAQTQAQIDNDYNKRAVSARGGILGVAGNALAAYVGGGKK